MASRGLRRAVLLANNRVASCFAAEAVHGSKNPSMFSARMFSGASTWPQKHTFLSVCMPHLRRMCQVQCDRVSCSAQLLLTTLPPYLLLTLLTPQLQWSPMGCAGSTGAQEQVKKGGLNVSIAGGSVGGLC